LIVARGKQRRISPQHEPALGAQHAVQEDQIALDGLQVGFCRRTDSTYR
jgi:hypothetical protein